VTDLSRFDVAVVGGGPAGLATTIALRRKGLAVVVAERTDYRSPRVGEHIPPGTKLQLASLGLADVLASGGHASCPGIRSMWGSDEPIDRDYLFHPNGEGLNLSRPDFDLSLAALAEQLGAMVITEARIAGLSRRASSWQLLIRHAKGALETNASVVIDATGRAASIAKRLGARPIVYDELIGIFGRVPDAAPRNNLVTIEALPQGWWYSAGLADGSVVATFMTDPELVETSKANRIRTWRDRIKAAPMTAARIADHDHSIDLHIRTARTQRLDEPIGDCWLAVGDAAMSFDPLSSEGISKGLEGGKQAAAVAAALCMGDRSAAQAYREDIGKAFAEYLATRHRYYAAERRWPDAPFWRRRRLPNLVPNIRAISPSVVTPSRGNVG
jgi:flavin-dependent dehydrogenase